MSASDASHAGSPPRGRKNDSSFPLLAATLLIFAVIAGTAFLLLRPTTLRIAVGPPGSDDQKLIQGLAQSFVHEGSPVRLTVISTAGQAENISLLVAGETDLAVVRTDEEIPSGTGAVAILRKNVVVLWAPSGAPRKGSKKDAKSKIKDIHDLEGHRVGIVGRTQLNVTLLRVVLTESGVNPDKVAVSQFSTSQIAEMLRDSSIDAFMTVGPLDSKITTEAITSTARVRGEPTFLAVDASEAIAHKHPLYEAEEIPVSSFTSSPARPEETVETVGVNHLIVAPKSLSESAVGAFTRALFAVRPALAKEIPAAAKIEKPDTDKDAAVPVHPGAAAYLDGDLKTFFDRYSDLFYWGLMAMSVLGSGFAGLLSYSKADDRVRKLHTLERLLEIAKAARSAESIKALDDLQAEIDAIQSDMIHEVEAGTLDETAMMAYAMSVERAQLTISDRRPTVQDLPPRPLAAVASL